MNQLLRTPHALVIAAALAAAGNVAAQVLVQGPSSSRTPYMVPYNASAGLVRNITSILTTTNLVALTGAPATPYEWAGIPDGLGCYDNGDGTVTVLCNHEINNGSNPGAVRRHGASGTFVSELVIDKTTLQVVSARDLIHTYVDINGVDRNVTNSNPLSLGRFCSGDLAAPSAFYNSVSGLGTTERIYMCGEEGPSTGYAVAAVATGAQQGRAYLLPRFNLATNGSGINAVAAWENLVASPYEQDLTVVVGTSDGGSGIMNNTVTVYVGNKQVTGNPVERAGLTNGTNYILGVVGNPSEIVSTTTRATNITSGTRFTLNLNSAGTTFSRPEDGQWDPLNPRDFYFVTTDRLDTATNTGLNQTIGSSGTANQIGKTRLWRLRFDSITNPLLGGEIHLVIDGSKNGQKVQMFDNMTVGDDGMIYLNEDPGNSTYIGKTWAYDPNTDTLVGLAKFDPARWGDLVVNGGTPGGVLPWTNDKESSGIIDVTSMFPHAADERVLLFVVQDHSNNAAVATPSSVEGGQLLLMRVALRGRTEAFGAACGGIGIAAAVSSLPRIGSTYDTDVSGVATAATTFMAIGASKTSWIGNPLPLDLTGLGLPGCWLLQDLFYDGAAATAVTGLNSARYSLAIPSVFSLVGFNLHLQAWTSAGQVSQGLTVVVGL
jgi:hypothetical protein